MISILKNPGTFRNSSINISSKLGKKIANNGNGASSNHGFKTYLKNAVNSTTVLDPPQSIEIFNAINSLNSHKACRYNYISASFLCLGYEVLILTLTVYFDVAFKQVFLKILKLPITPV